MILEGYDAIVVNAASPTALNGAVRRPATRASWSCPSTAS
jgi:ABC-type sugar transport system substrate-binding protein